jgi:hypothetical protein
MDIGQTFEGEIEVRDATTKWIYQSVHMPAASSMGEENDTRYTTFE